MFPHNCHVVPWVTAASPPAPMWCAVALCPAPCRHRWRYLGSISVCGDHHPAWGSRLSDAATRDACLCVYFFLFSLISDESRDSGGPSQGGTQPRVSLLPQDAEHGQPATGVDSVPLLEHQGLPMVPSEDPEARVQLQEVVPTRSEASQEQAPQAQAPAAPGGPDQTEAAVPLHALEQQYEQKYVLKDGSPEATNRIYFEFGQEVPKTSWRMFMRLAGLEENDIVICEHENPGNLAEQHHRMLLRWQSKLGRAASPFRLMAVLCKMQLRECLENIINKLVTEDILGSKDAEPPN
ncbi:hypothetical protein HJG60_011432 [Phyllostomus discolor]|uniref:Death domain-containing protein n=1 Tax=Phyllostomus discolor TaxID=89673 RepID=A0A834E5F4_9CHIR|nr:hypothetical protein HJG60_011432 [Phyllostomus discolor]